LFYFSKYVTYVVGQNGCDDVI